MALNRGAQMSFEMVLCPAISSAKRIVLAAVCVTMLANGPIGYARGADDVEDLKDIWKSQKTEIATAHIRYRLFQWGASGLAPLNPEQVSKIIKSVDLAARPDDLAIIVNKLLQKPHSSPTPWGVHDFYFEGTKSKDAGRGDGGEVHVQNDNVKVEHDPVNGQAQMFAAGGSRRHMRGMSEFRVVPNSELKYDIVATNGNTLTLRTVGGSGGSRLAVDIPTGSLISSASYINQKIISQVFHGSFLTYPGGITFPSLSATVTYGPDQVLYAISLSWVEDATFNRDLPSDTFAVPIPEKTNVFDARSPEHVKTFPLAGPSDDVVKLVNSRQQSQQAATNNRLWWIIGNIALFVMLIGILMWRRYHLKHP